MSTMNPCAKCRKLIYAGVGHTCPDSACYYHVPLFNPAPSTTHPNQSAQAVDVVAIREVIAYLKIGHRFDVGMADKLEAAINTTGAIGEND